MSLARTAGRFASRIAALLLCVFPVVAQTDRTSVSVRPVGAASLAVKPRSAATLIFRVANDSGRDLELAGRLTLPEGWKPVMGEAPFRLAAGAETIRLVPVFVPVEARAGAYSVGYLVGALNDPPVLAEGKAEITVLQDARLGLQSLDLPPFAIAGDVCRSRFLVSNLGNIALDVDLAVKSNGYEVTCDMKRIRIEAGESRRIEVAVRSDTGLRKKLIQQVELFAEAAVANGPVLKASALTQQEIIPRVYGINDAYNKLPMEVGLIALAGGGATSGQFMVSGSGALDASGKRTVDALFRGPGHADFNLFGMQREEYRLKVDSPNAGLALGDKVYSLTNLTNLGEYGRGAEARLSFGPWSVRGYAAKNLFIASPDTDRAFQLGYTPWNAFSLKLNYMSESRPGRQNSRILSLQSRYSCRLADVTVEYSWDRTAGTGLRPANTALWLEAGGSAGIASYRVNLIRSGSEYQGYYQNLDFRSAEFSLIPWTKLQVRASYLDQRRNTAIFPYFLPFYDRTFQAGLQYQAKPWLNLSLEQRIHDREDLSQDARFAYRDSTVRTGALGQFGPFSVQGYFDFGSTHNTLTGESERLAEYTFSLNAVVINSFTVGGYVHYRNQKETFTGDRERQLDLNFNAGYQTGRTRLEAFYRTSMHQELYQTALSEKSFENPLFLLNNYDMFGLSVTQRFANGHQLSLRVQRAAGSFAAGEAGRRLIGLLEYSIPLGMPVSRKTTIGSLRGKIYDAEDGRKGVAGAVVRANDLATLTGKNGDYAFNGLEPGRYLLTLEAPAEARSKITLERTPLGVDVAGGRNSECSIGLVTGSAILGRITVYKPERSNAALSIKAPAESGPTPSDAVDKPKADEAKPKMIESGALAAAVVELVGADGEVLHARTDEDGRFAFEGLRPGKVTVSVLTDTLPELHVFEKESFEIDLAPGSRHQVEFKVFPVVRPVQIITSGEVTIIKKNPVN